MKKMMIFACFMFIINYFSEAIDIKKYKIKSGIIEYKVEGMSEGTETLYFDDWGIKEAKYTKTVTKLMGFTVETNTVSITDKDWTYTINLDEKTGTKVQSKQIKDMLDKLTEKDYENYGKKVMDDLGAKKIGSETILGKNCEVWDISKISSKIWTYEYIPLKTEINIMGKMTYTATKLDLNVKISNDKFKVPDGIKITEQNMDEMNLDDMFKLMQKGAEESEENKNE